VTPAVSVAFDLRGVLECEPEILLRGCMLLTPYQRAALRFALAAADSPGMSLITDAEQAAEKVFREVETKVGEFDAAALAEARRLLADAKMAESRLVTLVGNYRTEARALVQKYGPLVVADVDAEMTRLLTQVEALFGTTGQ
jgi:phosphoglycolate phosphatase-like HAD superfamily hydrolase